MRKELQKPIIGFSCGDINGVGIELIVKVLMDSRINDLCTPVVFVNSKALNFYKKSVGDIALAYSIVKESNRLNTKQANIFNSWEEDIVITPGKLDTTLGRYAYLSLKNAVEALKEGWIDGLVTMPIHKMTIQSEEFKYSGHTPYLRDAFDKQEVLMLLVAQNMRVAVVTEHIPVKEVATHLNQELILRKLRLLHQSLKRDFNINKPRIAVLGLNPHCGDEGLIGDEEQKIIRPALEQARKEDILAFGPFSADAFFARGQYENVDAVLAMYHDQGLIPFKSLAIGEGVNFTAGLPIVRTSPDHGTAFDIAGKNKADVSSSMASLFMCIDILRNRVDYDVAHSNPLMRKSEKIIGNVEDEAVEE